MSARAKHRRRVHQGLCPQVPTESGSDPMTLARQSVRAYRSADLLKIDANGRGGPARFSARLVNVFPSGQGHAHSPTPGDARFTKKAQLGFRLAHGSIELTEADGL